MKLMCGNRDNEKQQLKKKEGKKRRKKKTANPWEGGESDFLTYYIIRFKYCVLNNKKQTNIPKGLL